MHIFTDYRSWPELYGDLKHRLLRCGDDVDTGHWQSLKNVPHTKTRELQHVALEVPIQTTVEGWQMWFTGNPESVLYDANAPHGLNLPWAENHFLERVAGEPLNPGEQYRNWPWYKSGVEDHRKCEDCGEPWSRHKKGGDLHDVCTFEGGQAKFSHTYMERLWSKYANPETLELQRVSGRPRTALGPDVHVQREYFARTGIRYAYGDLSTLLRLLIDEPYTRQAYLPIWFPEDLTAAADEHERVPCTLGWHFMLRGEQLHCFYPMRSVDLYRYLPDDLYMAGRLMQWIIEKLSECDCAGEVMGYHEQANCPSQLWPGVKPGKLTLFASSLHVFEGDLPRLTRDVKQFEKDYGHATS